MTETSEKTRRASETSARRPLRICHLAYTFYENDQEFDSWYWVVDVGDPPLQRMFKDWIEHSQCQLTFVTKGHNVETVSIPIGDWSSLEAIAEHNASRDDLNIAAAFDEFNRVFEEAKTRFDNRVDAILELASKHGPSAS